MEQVQKYFKIVNPNGHNGLVYHDGYNEDPLPFNPNGDCAPGGIYFASSDIFFFLDYGTDVYEVEPVGKFYKNPKKPKKYKAHALNMQYIGKINDVNTIKYLVENGANIHACNDYILRWFADKGDLEVVKYLVEQGANIHVNNDEVLCISAEHENVETVKYLIENGADILELIKYLKSLE